MNPGSFLEWNKRQYNQVLYYSLQLIPLAQDFLPYTDTDPGPRARV